MYAADNENRIFTNENDNYDDNTQQPLIQNQFNVSVIDDDAHNSSTRKDPPVPGESPLQGRDLSRNKTYLSGSGREQNMVTDPNPREAGSTLQSLLDLDLFSSNETRQSIEQILIIYRE
jgi:hypothetical protein